MHIRSKTNADVDAIAEVTAAAFQTLAISNHTEQFIIAAPRAAQPPDFAQILALNEASVNSLSPLDAERLAWLDSLAAYHRVIEAGDRISAFLLAFREGSAYDSPNYRWFATRYARFLYIDRVVVASALRGRGIGQLFYEDVFAFARSSGVGLVTCEFDLEPPNPASRRFHESLGFAEIGTQTYGPAGKRVSLRAIALKAVLPHPTVDEPEGP